MFNKENKTERRKPWSEMVSARKCDRTKGSGKLIPDICTNSASKMAMEL